MTDATLLRDPAFRRVLGAHGASFFGDRIINVALAFAVLELGGGATEVGLVFAARLAPMVASLLVGGVVADRVSRRAVMVVADLVRLGTQGAMAVLLLTGAAEIWMLAALAGAGGVATGFFSPASTGLLPLVVAPERLQEANGLRAIVTGAGEIGGPVTGGLLVAGVGPGWAIAVDAVTFAVSAALLVGLRLAPRAAAAGGSFLEDLRDGWTAFRSRAWVWSFVAGAALGNMVFAAWGVLGPVIADRELGGAAAWGLVTGALGAGSLLGGIVALRVRPARPIVAATAMAALLSAPLALLAAGVPAAVLAAGAFAAGLGMVVSNTLWESTLQRHVPADVLSRVSAYDWFGSMAFYPVGMAIWGPLAGVLGEAEVLWLACGVLLTTSLAVLSVREVRALGPQPG